MTTRRKIPVDFASVQSSRTCCTTALNKALDQLKAIPVSTSEEILLIKSEDVDGVLTAILKTETTFLQSMEDGQFFIPEEDDDEFLLEEDLAEESFNDLLFDINYKRKQLLCMKAVTNGLSNIYSDIEEIQVTINSSPEINQVSDIDELHTLLCSLRKQWQTANLPRIHPITLEIQSCKRTLLDLSASAQRLLHPREAVSYPQILPLLPPLAETTDCLLEVAAETENDNPLNRTLADPPLLVQAEQAETLSANGTSTMASLSESSPKMSNFHPSEDEQSHSQQKEYVYSASPSSFLPASPARASKLPLEASKIISSTVQATDCTISQQVTATTASPLLNKLNIPCRPAAVQPGTDFILKEYPHPQSLQLIDTANINPRRINILPGSDSWLQSQGQFCPIIAPTSELGAQNIILGCAITGITTAQGLCQQNLPACNLQLNSSTDISTSLASASRLANPIEEPELLLFPTNSHIKHSHSPHSNHSDYSNPVYFSSSNCRHQMTLLEKSDCQPPGEDSRQAVLQRLALSQQQREKGQKKHSTWRDEFPCLSSRKLSKSFNLTDPDSISPGFYQFSDSSLQNCGTLVYPRTTSQKHPHFTSLATSKPSSSTCVPAAEHPTFCVDTEISHQELLPLPFWRTQSPTPSEDPGPKSQQLPQKELLEFQSAISKQPPQKELLEFHPATSKQPPQKELLDLTLSTISKQPLQTELLELPTCVDNSNTISTLAADLGNLSSTHSYVLFSTDWCWEYHSNFIYQGAPSPPATNCLPLVILHHQNPAASSMPNLTGAEKKTAEIWLLNQAKIYLYSEKSSIRKKTFFSKSSRLMPWHPILDYSKMIKLPNNSIRHSIQQHQLLADASNFSTYKWLRYPNLTLCHYGSISFCTTGTTFILLSARRLSRLVHSNSYWRNQPHLHHQLMGEFSAVTNSFTPPFLNIKINFANPSTVRKGNLQPQNTAVFKTALHGFTTWSNFRQMQKFLITENNHHLIHLHLLKLLIRWLHIPAGILNLENHWVPNTGLTSN